MTPGEFLRAIWPGEGVYCLATQFTPDGETHKIFSNKQFDTISDAVSFCLNNLHKNDLFFGVHTFREKQVWNPTKLNYKTGEIGSNEFRTQRNAKESRAFFFDIDVGPEPEKYASQHDALAALKQFCAVTKIPLPMVISSGTGLHVYWIIVDPIPSPEWRSHAVKLNQLAQYHGFKADRSATADSARVLRVCGSNHLKDKLNPKPVSALTQPMIFGTGAFIKTIDNAMISAGIEAKVIPQLDVVESILGSNTGKTFEGPPVTMIAVLTACAQMRRLAVASKMKQPITDPEWYHGIIGVGRFVEDSHRRIMQFGDEGWRDKIRDKIAQSERRQTGPTSCAKLAEVSRVGDEPCAGCQFAGKVHGPIQAARFRDPAPPPVVIEQAEGAAEPIKIELPDPPKPYVRMKGGGVATTVKTADEGEMTVLLYEHDLFPVRRLVNPTAGVEQLVWHVELPRDGAKDFTLDADMLYDVRKFASAVSNQGVYAHRGNLTGLQEYMVAYIAQLQKLVDADQQANHLGWSDDFTSFILPDRIIGTDGTVRSAQLSIGAQRASLAVHRKGTLEKQVELLKFYDQPNYLPHQFFILCSLASALFYATGHHGVIVNATGVSGASKSTSLYAAASFWGQPDLYPVNGTNNGATVRGRNERIMVLANLPVCVDEITHMPVNDAKDLAMSITQPGHRIRLDTSGVERATVGSYKSTMMLSTANNSLHGLLSQDNAAGTAGSMRVFEIRFEKTTVHTKSQADDFLHELKENYGHIGPLFIANCMPRLTEIKERIRAKVSEIDRAMNIQGSERYWSASIGPAIVTAELAQEMGLLTYSPQELLKWACEVQVPQMRGVVSEEYSDPLSTLTDYLEQISGNMVVMDQSAVGSNAYCARKPVGALYAHYDRPDHMLYVLRKAFKDYCSRIGSNATKILEDLHIPREGDRIIASTNTKKTLGAGTEYAKGQSWCFSVNMAHPDVSGVVALQVLQGGGQPTARPPTGLQLVQ